MGQGHEGERGMKDFLHVFLGHLLLLFSLPVIP